MSCLSGSPCYNNTITYSGCGGDPCNPANRLSCEAMVYNGPNLSCSGIDSCDTICVALQKIDNAICNSPGSTVTASNGLTKDLILNDIQLGGTLTKTTIINTGTYDLMLTGIDNGSSSDDILVLTNTGVIRKVDPASILPAITLVDNTGLEWTDAPTNSTLQTIYNTLVEDNITSVEVGGAAPTLASVWKTKTLVEVLDTILFPLQLPTYTIATVGISAPSTQTLEVGSTLSINSTITANKFDAGAFISLSMSKAVNGAGFSVVGGPYTPSSTTGASFGTEFGFADPNSPNIVYTSTYTETLTIPAPASGSTSTVQYKASGPHNAGLPKLTSNNVSDSRVAACDTTSAPQSACTTESATATITGRYPIFYGTTTGSAPSTSTIASLIQAGSATKLAIATNGASAITVPFGTQTNKWFYIAVPASYSNKSYFKPLWYPIENTFSPSNAWNIYGTVNVTSPNGYWSGISYTIYRSTSITDTAGDFQIY